MSILTKAIDLFIEYDSIVIGGGAMFEDDEDNFLLEGSEELFKAVAVPPEFDQILAYQTARVQPPEGEGDQQYMVLGAKTVVLDDDTVECFAILHGHSPVPCGEFLTSWRLPELL